VSRWRLDLLRRKARQRLFVGLDAHGMAWQFEGAPPSSATTANEAHAFAQQLTHKTRMDVVVANDVAVHWLQTPPAGVQSLTELRQIAASRCAHLFGGVPAGWWVAGDWSASQSFVCAGLPLDRVGPLHLALSQAGTVATWHTAWGLLCSRLAGTLPTEGWIAARSAGRVLVWRCQRGRVTALSSLNVGCWANDDEANEAVGQLLRMEALRDTVVVPGTVHWVEWPAPTPLAGGSALALAPWVTGAVR
jgi:hypothetical protein